MSSPIPRAFHMLLRRHVSLRCHKEILSQASPLIRLEVRQAEAERLLRDARPLFQARAPARRSFQQQKLRVARPSLLEFKLCRWAKALPKGTRRCRGVREEPQAFAEILALLYGTPIKARW